MLTQTNDSTLLQLNQRVITNCRTNQYVVLLSIGALQKTVLTLSLLHHPRLSKELALSSIAGTLPEGIALLVSRCCTSLSSSEVDVKGPSLGSRRSIQLATSDPWLVATLPIKPSGIVDWRQAQSCWCTLMNFSLGNYTLVTDTSGLLMATIGYGPCQGRDNLCFLPVSSWEV